jgi:hypothetical protein
MMSKLQQAILAQLPRVDEEGQGNYQTAQGLKYELDAHPLVWQSSVRNLEDNLRTLAKAGDCICLRRYQGRPRIIGYAVQPVKRR